jgi:hypothetical protein
MDWYIMMITIKRVVEVAKHSHDPDPQNRLRGCGGWKDYNTRPLPGKGDAVFLFLWKGE